MVEAKLNGESAKDLVSGIKIAETRVGDFFRAAKAGYKAGHAAYKSAKKDLDRLRDGYKLARDAVSSGASVSSMIDKHKGKNSTTSFGSKGSVERPIMLRPSDQIAADKLSDHYKKFNLTPNHPTSSADITNVNLRYAQVRGVENAIADAMSDWDRDEKGRNTETLPRMSKSSDSVSHSRMIPGIHAGQMGLKGDSVAAVTTNGKEKFVGVHALKGPKKNTIR